MEPHICKRCGSECGDMGHYIQYLYYFECLVQLKNAYIDRKMYRFASHVLVPSENTKMYRITSYVLAPPKNIFVRAQCALYNTLFYRRRIFNYERAHRFYIPQVRCHTEKYGEFKHKYICVDMAILSVCSIVLSMLYGYSIPYVGGCMSVGYYFGIFVLAPLLCRV
jgi:hypothetical protein